MVLNTRLVFTILLAVLIGIVLLFIADVASQDEVMTFREHMHGHLDEVSAVKAGVVAGDLDAARLPATWLAEHEEPPGMPEAWAPYVEELRRHARVAADAADLEMAAVAVSEIARTCGECHRATGFDVAFGYDQRPPAEVQNLTTQMQRHLWAADRMWDALIGPSDNAWRWGTEMLAEVKLSPEQFGGDTKAQAAMERLSELGRQGSLVTSGPARAGLYGEFLAQCAACHGVTGGGPGNY
jgi:cytochrome c553